MPYKIENDLQALLREQELIESSESFIHDLEGIFRSNITLPSYQNDQTVMRGIAVSQRHRCDCGCHRRRRCKRL